MATKSGKQAENGGMVGRLAGKGEEALTRLGNELGKNPRVSDALGRALSAKGKLDETSRGVLGQIGLAAADEIRDLRGQLERLEQRLERLEGTGAGKRTSAKRSETKKVPSAKRSTKPASATSREKAEGSASPAPGRAIGGGTGRGGGASSGAGS